MNEDKKPEQQIVPEAPEASIIPVLFLIEK
jgi:hypothetical protein